MGEITAEDDRSYVVVASPEIEVHKCTVVLGQKSSCTTDGWNDYYDCVCGKHFEDMAATIEIADLEAWKIGDGKIPASHTYGTLIEAKPEVHTQTKLEASVAAHYFCDVCDTYFTEGKVATTLQALTGTVPSHNYVNKYAYKTDDGHADTCSCGVHNAVVNHKYTNACDGDCNDCGKTRTPAVHQYDNACDKTCNICKATRTVPAHKYSNACDKTCNVCKATRTIKHTYKKVITKATLTKNGKIQNKCSVCGYVASKVTTISKIKSAKLSGTTYTYNGKAKTPSVTVKDAAGKVLKKGTDYVVTYSSGRKKVGTYKVKISFRGNYSGSKTLTFKVNPAKTAVSRLTAGTKKLTVSITKKKARVSGYQLQYSASKKFTSAKTKNTTATKVTLKGLKAKKTYYVRVRTYKTVGGVKYYSGWSTYKYVKTK